MVLRYAPVLRDFDETADRPFLRKLEDLYGDRDGIRLTEGESLIVGRKDDQVTRRSANERCDCRGHQDCPYY